MKKLLILMLILVATGCTKFVQRPEITYRDFKISGVDTSGMSFDLLLSVFNPNSYNLALDGYTYNLKVLDMPLTSGGARNRVDFPGKTERDLRIPVRVSFREFVEILKHRPDPDRIPYSLSTGLELDTPVGNMYIPVEKAGTVAVPDQYRPSFYLNKFKDLFGGAGSPDDEGDAAKTP